MIYDEDHLTNFTTKRALTLEQFHSNLRHIPDVSLLRIVCNIIANTKRSINVTNNRRITRDWRLFNRYKYRAVIQSPRMIIYFSILAQGISRSRLPGKWTKNREPWNQENNMICTNDELVRIYKHYFWRIRCARDITPIQRCFAFRAATEHEINYRRHRRPDLLPDIYLTLKRDRRYPRGAAF